MSGKMNEQLLNIMGSVDEEYIQEYIDAQAKSHKFLRTRMHELENCIPEGAAFDKDADELRQAINGFLAGLSAEDRILFMGHYFALESIESLAESNRLTQNTINTRLSRMLKELENYLTERGIFI